MAEGVMLVAKFSADVSEFVDSMKEVASSAADAADAIKLIGQGAAAGDLQAMGVGAQAAGGALVDLGKGAMDAVFELQMIVDVAKQVGDALLGTAIAAQKSQQEFTDSMKGDVGAAKDLYDAIEALATAKGLDTDGLEKVGAYMLAIGIDAKNVVPEMDAVAGAVAKVGGGADMVQQVVEALNKMQEEGKVTVLAMTRLEDAGINAKEALAAGMGVTVTEAMAKVASGTMDATTAVTDMIAGFKKLDGASTETTTLGGAWTKLTDQLGGVAAKVFGPLIEAVTIVLGLIGKLFDAIGNLGTAIGKAFGNDNAGKIDAQSQAFADWAASSSAATTATNTFDASLNQTTPSLAKTTTATTTATTATTTSTSATTAHTTAVTTQGTVIDGTTQRFAPYAAGIKSADIATANAAGSAGTYSWAISSGAQAYTVSADKAAAFAKQTDDIKTKLQEGAAAAKAASTAIGDVIPGSLQDQINNAGNGMGTLAVHFTETGQAASKGSDQASQAVNNMNDAIQLFAQQSHQSFNSAKQNVEDYAKFTGQSMEQATKALSMQGVQPEGLEEYNQKSEGILGQLGDKYAAFGQSVMQILQNIGSALSMSGGNAEVPSFASGVQGYTGMAIVGESGPELVSLNGGSVYPLTGTGGANLPAMGGGMSGGPVSIQVIMDSQVIAQAVLPQIAPQIRMAVGRRA